MRSDFMLPKIALVDPLLSKDAPLKVAAAASLDALTHLIEGYVSRGAQPTTDALARRGMEIMFRALCTLALPENERPPDSAADLALGSMWGGIVLANAGLGAVHGLVAPLGGLCAVAHGDGCACLLPATFLQNAQALRRRGGSSLALRRYQEMAAIFCDEDPASARDADALIEKAAERLYALRKSLGVRSLSQQGVSAENFSQIVSQSRGGSMRYNPVELTDAELERILLASLV
jgi:alcohol dehydrogenase class IV